MPHVVEFTDEWSPLAKALAVIDMQASALDALRLELVEARGERDGLRFAMGELTELIAKLPERIEVVAPPPKIVEVQSPTAPTLSEIQWHHLPLDQKKARMIQTLTETCGAVGLTGKRLGVQRQTIVHWARKFDLDIFSFRKVMDRKQCERCPNMFDVYVARSNARLCMACRTAVSVPASRASLAGV